MTDHHKMTKRKYPDVWADPEDDPREGGPRLADERTTLMEVLRVQRLTLEMKCSGLDPAELARRSVEPSTLSLLGLVRHMADVERVWFRVRMAELDVPPMHFRTATDRDAAFNDAVGDPAAVEEAWRLWREEIEFANQYVAGAPDLDVTRNIEGYRPISLREVLVHMIGEYARHNGHADLLRERIDGRTGQ